MLANREEIVARHSAGELPQMFVERIQGHYRDEIYREFCEDLVYLHNSQEIDVLEVARVIGESPISQSEFFFVQSIFVELIPKLHAEVPVMLAAVKALVARAGNDLASGVPNGAYRTWAETGDRAFATLAAIDLNNPEDAAYALLSLQALAQSEPEAALIHAISLLNGSFEPARIAAAKAIGTLPLATTEACTRAADALEAARTNGANDNLLGHILTAVCEIARTMPEMEPFALALIASASPHVGEQAIHQVSLELMFHSKDLPPTIVAALTDIAHKVAIQNLGTLNNIDSAAYALIKDSRIKEGLALITPLISTHETLSNLEIFKSSSHALLDLEGGELASVIAGWLLTPNINLGIAARNLVGGHHGSPLVLHLDACSLALSDAHAMVLARRAIGYLFVHPITAASLVLALIRLADPEPQQALADILFDPLLISYSGSLAEWLQTKTKDESDPARLMVENLLARLNSYMDGLQNAGQIKELRPSERERLIEGHRQQETMWQTRKKAQKSSILMSLAKRSVLLYGNRSISYFSGPDGIAQRNEMKMHSMSHSFEIPRLDILEPFDLDYTLRVFRMTRVAQ